MSFSPESPLKKPSGGRDTASDTMPAVAIAIAPAIHPLPERIGTRRQHRRVALGNERTVSAPRVWPRQTGHTGELARHRHARAGEKRPRDLAQRLVAADAVAQQVGK